MSRNSTVWLCTTPLEKDNNHQIRFDNVASRDSYFTTVSTRTVQGMSYVRIPVEGKIQSYISINENIENLYGFNYVMFQNDSGKKYFAFIDYLEYRSQTVTYIHIILDSFQTYQFDLEFKKCFIERETPLTDNKNTLADDVAHGQLIELDKTIKYFDGAYFVFCSTDITQDVTTDSTPYGLKIGNYTIPCWVLYFPTGDTQAIQDVMQRISDKGRGDRIIGAVYVPLINDLVSGTNMTLQHFNSTDVGTFDLVTEIQESALTQEITFTPDSSLLTGMLQKELTYPYSKIVVEDTTTGQTIELAPEKFNGGTYSFEVRCLISETPQYKIIPKNYEGQPLAYNHSLTTTCQTSLPVVNNLYAKYMMFNKDSNDLRRFGAIAGFGMASMSGNPFALTETGLSMYQELSSVAVKESQASMLGNSVTQITDGIQERILFNNGIKISLWTMDEKHTDMARSYWTMFGYPVKKLAVPLMEGSKGYYFCKLGMTNIIGQYVPQQDMDNIKNLFTRGITLWNSSGSMFNY